jgi:poly(hydroxyalkanoate) granule-associated protein
VVRKLSDIANERTQAEPASALADAIRESAEKIWLAGLGAFASARRDPGGAFESLIRDGLALQARSRAAADERVQAAHHDLAGRTAQSWDRLERIFEQRIAAALERVGVPSAAQLQALGERVDALTATVRELEAAARALAPARATVHRTARAKAVPAATTGPGKVDGPATGKRARPAAGKGEKPPVGKGAGADAAKGAKTLARKSPRR